MIKSFLYIVPIIGIFCFSFHQNEVPNFRKDQDWTKHNIVLKDPAHVSGEPIDVVIWERKRSDGLPIEYLMDVPSVYCHDNVCKIVPVRLFWNPMGAYQHFELEKPYKLEKADGKFFSKKEYLKLDRILRDKQSPFNGISIQKITQASSSEGVDAVSGATTILLDDQATVKGATLTCYTLWVWANGEVTNKIRDISGNQFNTDDFVGLLNSNDKNKVIFALEQLTKRKIYDVPVLTAIMPIVSQQGVQYIKSLRKYLDGAPNGVYFEMGSDWYKYSNEKMRVEILHSALTSNFKGEVDFCLEALDLVKQSGTYMEVDLLLKLLAKDGIQDEKTTQSLLPLLESDILIARRVYWYLHDLDMPYPIKNKLKEFEKKNREYL